MFLFSASRRATGLPRVANAGPLPAGLDSARRVAYLSPLRVILKIITKAGVNMFQSAQLSGAVEQEGSARATTLARLELLQGARIRALRLGEAELDWIRAVGLFEGERLCVLRRAVWGGPLHVRTASGGEFALDRRLAARIDVETAA